MAEKKQKRIVSADTGKDVTKKARTKVSGKGATPTGSTGGLRFGAIFLWVLAIACEVMALMVLWGKISIGSIPMLYSLIGFLVLDFCSYWFTTLEKSKSHQTSFRKKQVYFLALEQSWIYR